VAPNNTVGLQGQNFHFVAFFWVVQAVVTTQMISLPFFLRYEPSDYPYCKIIICDKRGAISLPAQLHKFFFGIKMKKRPCDLVF
jgi:hypothetical protein